MKRARSIGLELWASLNEEHVRCADEWLEASRNVTRFNRKRRKKAPLSEADAAQRVSLYAALDSASSDLMDAAFAMVPYLYERKRYPDPAPGVPKRLIVSDTALPLELDPIDTIAALLGNYTDRFASASRASARFEREHRGKILCLDDPAAAAMREVLHADRMALSTQIRRLTGAMMPYHYAKLPAIDVTPAAPTRRAS